MILHARRAFAAVLAAACLAGVSAPTGSGASATIPPAALTPDRLEALSRPYLGTRYKLDCLGEGQGPDFDPLFTRKYVDCQTLVEQVVAEAVAPYVGGLNQAVRLIRYRDSNVCLENRYHYCVPDWLENDWPARDVTRQVSGAAVRTATRRIDRAVLLAARGARNAAGIPVETVKEDYIPRSLVPSVASRIPGGSIAVFVLNRPNIVAGHLGFVFDTKHGQVFRHASQTRKCVIDEPLAAYLARAPRNFIGVMVLQPDPAGLHR